jgi:predicted methyltransferase
MEINRIWQMPNKNTFSIKPIRTLIDKYNNENLLSIDPFSNTNKLAKITNDIDPQYGTTFNLDALDFLKTFEDNSVDLILYDPPFSPRQVSESYKKMNMSVNMQTTQASFWGNLKKEMGRIVKSGGIVISCGWTSGGVGKSNGFDILEILLVPHGGNHNDTIIVVDKKI